MIEKEEKMILESYQEWKNQENRNKALKKADEMIQEAYVIMRPQQTSQPDIPSSLDSQKRMMELGEILFKVQSLQCLYRGSQGKEIEKYQKIIKELFDLAHMKIEQAKEAFLDQKEIEKEEEPEMKAYAAVRPPEAVPSEEDILPQESEELPEDNMDTEEGGAESDIDGEEDLVSLV